MILVRFFDGDKICKIMDKIVCAALPNSVNIFILQENTKMMIL